MGILSAGFYGDFRQRIRQVIARGDLRQHQQVTEPPIREYIKYRSRWINDSAWIFLRKNFYLDPEKQYPAKKSIKLFLQREPVKYLLVTE